MENTEHTSAVTIDTHLSRQRETGNSLDSTDVLGHMRHRRQLSGLHELAIVQTIAERMARKLETLAQDIHRKGLDVNLTSCFSIPGEMRGLETALNQFEAQRKMLETLDDVEPLING